MKKEYTLDQNSSDDHLYYLPFYFPRNNTVIIPQVSFQTFSHSHRFAEKTGSTALFFCYINGIIPFASFCDLLYHFIIDHKVSIICSFFLNSYVLLCQSMRTVGFLGYCIFFTNTNHGTTNSR